MSTENHCFHVMAQIIIIYNGGKERKRERGKGEGRGGVKMRGRLGDGSSESTGVS